MTPPLAPLACPHCGQAPTVHECDWSEPPTWSVICGCTGCTHETAAAAIAAWNTRTPASEPSPDVCKLDGKRCYVGDGDDKRFRCGTVQCGALAPSDVRRQALEEAAKVAEADCMPGYGLHRNDMEYLAETQRRNIAAAIRALAQPAEETKP